MKINKQIMDEMLDYAARYPLIEVTGFVSTNQHGDQQYVPMKNMSSRPESEYAWDTTEMLQQWTRMDRENQHPIAIFHSHPQGQVGPSETDMLNALQVGFYYLIAHSTDGCWHLTSWECIDTGILVEAPLEVVP